MPCLLCIIDEKSTPEERPIHYLTVGELAKFRKTTWQGYACPCRKHRTMFATGVPALAKTMADADPSGTVSDPKYEAKIARRAAALECFVADMFDGEDDEEAYEANG